MRFYLAERKEQFKCLFWLLFKLYNLDNMSLIIKRSKNPQLIEKPCDVSLFQAIIF